MHSGRSLIGWNVCVHTNSAVFGTPKSALHILLFFLFLFFFGTLILIYTAPVPKESIGQSEGSIDVCGFLFFFSNEDTPRSIMHPFMRYLCVDLQDMTTARGCVQKENVLCRFLL